MDLESAVARYGTSAIVRSDRGARACHGECPTPLCPSQFLLAPVRAQERRYQPPPRRVTHRCGKLTVVIPYFPIRDEALKKIIGLKLGKIQKRLAESHKVQLTYSEEVLDEIANRCTEVESGARNVDNILTNTLLPELSMLILGRIAQGQQLESVRVQIGPAGEFVYS
jgi:hypothetical protein